jgi:hypothetical protein
MLIALLIALMLIAITVTTVLLITNACFLLNNKGLLCLTVTLPLNVIVLTS